MRIFSSNPITFNLSVSAATVEESINTAIKEVLGSSQIGVQRSISAQLADKVKITALTIKEISCNYWEDENFLRCKLSSLDDTESIVGEFELSRYEEELSSPLLKDLFQKTLNHAIRDPLISLFKRLP